MGRKSGKKLKALRLKKSVVVSDVLRAAEWILAEKR
jgi:hypothetical protein